jgi:prolyl-tRNA synthetase
MKFFDIIVLMFQSKIFGKTRREYPKDEVSKNAQLLIRAGFIEKASAGVYSYLPLGFRVLKKIEEIIRKEMELVGGQESLFPSLMSKELWSKTGRWDEWDEDAFKIKDNSGREFILGPSHEEIVSEIASKHIKTYRDLPLSVFQFQNKFRNEKRPKSGIMRGREFLMKDLYSFHKDEEDLDSFYEKMKKSYLNIFRKCGLNAFIVEASGGGFSDKYSHEFMVETSAGEDITLICEKCGWARNKEIAEKEKDCPNCKNKLKEKKTVEAGNIFNLGDKYSKKLNVNFIDKDGEKKPTIMGCYGIGLGRLMGTIAEIFNDTKGLIWPQSIAPFLIHLIYLPSLNEEKDKEIKKNCDEIYNLLREENIEVLYDDRKEQTAGEKFNDSDLIGIPFRIVISEKTISKNELELKKRNEDKVKFIKLNKSDILKEIKL